MIHPVVVEVNILKPFTHASPRLGELRRGSCKRLFYCPFDRSRTPYVNKHLHGWRGRKHKGSAITPLTTLTRLCARYWLKLSGHGETRQIDKRIASTMGSWQQSCGLKGEASHPWGTYAQINLKVKRMKVRTIRRRHNLSKLFREYSA